MQHKRRIYEVSLGMHFNQFRRRRWGNCDLFNDAHNTLYLQLHDIGHHNMVKDRQIPREEIPAVNSMGTLSD